eukprot:c27721_g1_i1.p1 GENE.c27721_g1_i1~~c27721_g1_i1.p1  ORF type:complete len:102 (+),score=4.19 c27721_g1_i1:87-392(+)
MDTEGDKMHLINIAWLVNCDCCCVWFLVCDIIFHQMLAHREPSNAASRLETFFSFFLSHSRMRFARLEPTHADVHETHARLGKSLLVVKHSCDAMPCTRFT